MPLYNGKGGSLLRGAAAMRLELTKIKKRVFKNRETRREGKEKILFFV